MSTPTLGIDFGTTTSSMAWVDPGTGKAEILKNAEGEEKTPSVVYFGAELVLVGTPAEQMLEDPEEGRRAVATICPRRSSGWSSSTLTTNANFSTTSSPLGSLGLQ